MIEEKIEGITAEITLSDDFFESYDIDEKSFMQLANGDIYKTTYEEGYDDGYAEVASGLVLGDAGLVSVLDIVKFSVATLICVVLIILLLKRVLGRSQSPGQSHFYFRS